MDLIWWGKCLCVGLAGGFLGGLLGVGGGIIMVPLLMYLVGLPVHQAKAASLAVIVMVGVAGSVQHHRLGLLHGQARFIIVAGLIACVGSVSGATLSQHVSSLALRRIFAALMIATAINMLRPTKPAQPEAAHGDEPTAAQAAR